MFTEHPVQSIYVFNRTLGLRMFIDESMKMEVP